MKSKEFIEQIKNKKSKIAIIGLGYVGLPLVKEFCNAGFKVTGFDIDENKIKKLNNKKSYIKHISFDDFKYENFTATSDFKRLKENNIIIICVPTPLTKYKDPDLTYVISTAETISKHIERNQLIILESTTYPGTTEEILVPILNKNSKNLRCGTDFFVAFSPEREDPGNERFGLKTIPKVVGGINKDSTKIASALYSEIVKYTVEVSNTKIAEASKILENIYRAVNIALVNELKVLFDKMGIDIWEVISAASTKPFGFHAFYPGPGLGGHCIPIDPFYLSWKAKEYGVNIRFIELAGEINTSMPQYVCYKAMEALNNIKKSINGANILLLGVAYKKNVDDIRESPALEIIEILKKMGAKVHYYDPYIPKIVSGRRPHIKMSSLKENDLSKCSFDAAIIVTNHDCFDYKKILKNINLVVDTRNALKSLKMPHIKLVKA